MQIVHQRANHLLQISSYRVNLCLQINYFVCKSGTSADENRWKSLFTDVFFLTTRKKNYSFVKYGSTLIYVKILLSCWIANMTSTSKLQTIQVLKVLCKRVPQNLCCWNNVERKFSTHIFIFSKHCYVLSLEILQISLWKLAEMKRLYHFEIF